MHELDDEMRKQSADAISLDDVLQALQRDPDRISLDILQRSVTALLGQPPAALQLDNLPGCRSIQTKSEES